MRSSLEHASVCKLPIQQAATGTLNNRRVPCLGRKHASRAGFTLGLRLWFCFLHVRSERIGLKRGYLPLASRS